MPFDIGVARLGTAGVERCRRRWYSTPVNSIDGYKDIHDNVRFWIERLTRSIRKDGAVVLYDIGSNDGEVTLPVLLGGAGETGAVLGERAGGVHLVAFEPLPGARARLINRVTGEGLTVALWGTADVTVIPLALGDTDRMITLDVYDDDTFSSLYERPPAELERYRLTAVEQVRVRMRPLDDLVRAGTVPPPDAIKIDVEGAELSVLRGAAETLSGWHPPILMEFSCVNAGNAGYDRAELVDLLESLGYTRIFGLFRNEDRYLYGKESFSDCRIWNVIALHDKTELPPGVVEEYRAAWEKDATR